MIVFTNRPESIEIMPVENWRAAAGVDAVRALDRLQDECAVMSPEEAEQRFGVSKLRTPEGEIVTIADTFDACGRAVRSHVFGMHIRGPSREIVFSNVFGEIFVEEMN